MVIFNPKLYRIKYQALDGQIKHQRTTIGVSNIVVTTQIEQDEYLNTLRTIEQVQREVVSIRSIDHEILTLKQTKIALTSYYDKIK